MLTQPLAPTRGINPFLQMRQAQRELGRAIGGLRLVSHVEFPAINLWANSDGAVLTAEVPGIEPDNLDIAVHLDVVTLRGRRDPEALSEGAVVHRSERITGDFVRSVTLPFRVDAEGVSARFKQGTLTLELPRPAAERPRRIQVQRG